MKFTKLKAVLAAALVAVAGLAAYAEDAPEETVVATGEASFWLGGDDLAALRVAKALSEQLESKYFYVTTFPKFYTDRVHEASAKISSK